MAVDKFLEDSITACKKVIDNDTITTRNTGKIYRNTNEVLTSILRPQLIEGKDILSVVASSDQVFTAHYLGAKSVDTFDNNILAYFYFFLRKWCMFHTGKHYIPADNKLVMESLIHHDNSVEEKRAYIFWKEILDYLGKESLYYSELFHKGSIWWNVPYQNDMNTMINIVQKLKPNYSRLNIYEPIDIPKQYDVIILSNILEYLYEEPEDYNYYKKMEIIINNLLSLLKPNGIAISSNILDYDYSGNYLFEKYFEYEEGPSGLNIRFNREVPLSYTYKKK